MAVTGHDRVQYFLTAAVLQGNACVKEYEQPKMNSLSVK